MTGVVTPTGSINVKIRRFIPNADAKHNCPKCVKLPHDGTKGHYEEWGEEMPVNNLFTNAGHDFISQQLYKNTGLGTNGANYIALSNDATAPAVTDTAVAGEITSNGLARAQGAYAHTNGTNTTTITESWTATATQGVQKAGLLTAASVGILVNEGILGPYTLNSGDQIQVVWTITA